MKRMTEAGLRKAIATGLVSAERLEGYAVNAKLALENMHAAVALDLPAQYTWFSLFLFHFYIDEAHAALRG